MFDPIWSAYPGSGRAEVQRAKAAQMGVQDAAWDAARQPLTLLAAGIAC